jgi:hypothetical protein
MVGRNKLSMKPYGLPQTGQHGGCGVIVS